MRAHLRGVGMLDSYLMEGGRHVLQIWMGLVCLGIQLFCVAGWDVWLAVIDGGLNDGVLPSIHSSQPTCRATGLHVVAGKGVLKVAAWYVQPPTERTCKVVLVGGESDQPSSIGPSLAGRKRPQSFNSYHCCTLAQMRGRGEQL